MTISDEEGQRLILAAERYKAERYEHFAAKAKVAERPYLYDIGYDTWLEVTEEKWSSWSLMSKVRAWLHAYGLDESSRAERIVATVESFNVAQRNDSV